MDPGQGEYVNDLRKILCHIRHLKDNTQVKTKVTSVQELTTCQPLLGLKSLGSHLPVLLDFFTLKSTIWHGSEQKSYLEIFSDEKAINSGGDAKVVNVMTPRTTLAHLDAPKPRGRYLVGEDSVLGNLREKIVQGGFLTGPP